MNYLCLGLSLFGISAFKSWNHSSLHFCSLACESTQKQPTHKLKLIDSPPKKCCSYAKLYLFLNCYKLLK